MDKNDKCVILKLQLHLHFQAAILKVHLCTCVFKLRFKGPITVAFSSCYFKGPIVYLRFQVAILMLQLHLHFRVAILKLQLHLHFQVVI